MTRQAHQSRLPALPIRTESDLILSLIHILKNLDLHNVSTRHGDGWQGWQARAPFDAIIVTAAPPEIPTALMTQLDEGGILVLPVGEEHQYLKRVRRRGGEFIIDTVEAVRFVPLVKMCIRDRNGIGLVDLTFDEPLVLDRYQQNPVTGGLIFIDRLSNVTVGAGMVHEPVSQATAAPSEFSAFELELNALVRRHFPHWGARDLLGDK